MLGLISLGDQVASADEVLGPEKIGQSLLQDLKSVESLNKDVKKVGTLEVACPGCSGTVSDLNLSLDNDEISLGNPHYRKANQPYVILLKRTSKTPRSIDLNFKNGYEYCEKMFVGTNPWVPSGPLVVDCMLYLTRYEDHEISLNFRDSKPLVNDEVEIIEIRLSKPVLRNSKYDIEIKNLSNSAMKIEKKKKFLGGGYNVSFESP